MNDFFKKPLVKVLMLKGEKGETGDVSKENFDKSINDLTDLISNNRSIIENANSKIDEAQDGIKNTNNRIDKAQDGIKNINNRIDEAQDEIKNANSKIYKAQDEIKNTNKRIDNLIVSSGSDSSAEVIDARTGYDGTSYNTLGTAIRSQANKLNNDLIYNLAYVTVNKITDCNYVTMQHNNVLHDLFNSGSPTPSNVPDNFKIGTASWHLLTFYFSGAWIQYLTDYRTVIYSRTFSIGSWQNWDKHDIGINMTTFNGINGISVNNIFENGIYPFNAEITPLDLPFDDWKDGSKWCIINFKFSNNPKNIQQILISVDNPFGKRQAYRHTSGENWQDWNICDGYMSTHKTFICEKGKTLRSVCEEAIKYDHSTVIVKSGTYDLVQEFNDHIASKSGSGIKLTNGIKIIFEAGAYVKAEIEQASEYSQNSFEPFYSAGDFELIGLNISAKNTRYCVHDESGGIGSQHHIYRNCQMKYRNNADVPHFSQCIGGGMGEHTFIEIHGGIYDSSVTNPSGSQTQKELDIPISYHNGNNSTCDGKIFISGVYLKNKGYFRFGYYGPSTIKSIVQISNCIVGQPTLVTQEQPNNVYPENFEVIEFNTVLRTR